MTVIIIQVNIATLADCKVSVRNNSWGHSRWFAYLSHAAFPWSYFSNLILQLTNLSSNISSMTFLCILWSVGDECKKIYFLTPFLLLDAVLKFILSAPRKKTAIFLTCDWFISCLGVVNWKKFTLNFDTFREKERKWTKKFPDTF